MSWVTAAIGKAPDTVDIHVDTRLVFTAHEPGAAGEGARVAPFDLLLASLGACTAITLKQYAVARDWPLETVEVDLSFVSRQRSSCVERILSIQGPLRPDQREALLAAVEQSPVTLLLSPGLHIHTELA